jgi:hypothetical protein
MSVDLSELDLGFVVSLGTLREVLRGMNIAGRRWWIASDPDDAAEAGFITVAHGTQQCVDRLNTLHFRIPVVGNGDWKARTDRLILMFDPSTTTAEEPGFYLGDGRIIEDPVEDISCFYTPIERALITRLQAKI